MIVTPCGSTRLLTRIADLRDQVSNWRRNGEKIGLVPTMGALHAGHMSLVTAIRPHVQRIIVSVFVNPAQFGPREDFASYPRTLDADLALLEADGVDACYAPGVAEMYPARFSTKVTPSALADCLCGTKRPGHFDGVALVVSKLLIQSAVDYAVFGEKDFQQLQVIRRTVRDLDIPVTVLAAPTLRAPDGLALSSRNTYLTARERGIAPLLHRALTQIAEIARQGGDVSSTIRQTRAGLMEAGFEKIDYLEMRDEATLSLLDRMDAVPARVFAAVYLGKTRLIDNISLN